MWNLVLVHLKTVLVPVQDRCTVCAKTTIGSQVILYAPDGSPSDKAQVEPRFGPFGESANLDTR
jgi:hypothetical protein